MGVVTRTEKLELGYPGEDSVCRDVSIEVSSGQVLALIGPNGAGKSTLLRGLAGLLKPRAGNVLIEDRPLNSLGAKEKARKVAFLPQELRFLEGTTVSSFVSGGRYAYRRLLRGETAQDRESIRQSMDQADVLRFKDTLIDELSGGQKQRVLLARALAQDADLLLVDEPTSSLDSRHQLMTFDRIKDAVSEGKAAIVVTHDLNLASQYADHIALLAEGRLLRMDRPEVVLTPEVLEPVYGSDLVFGECESSAAKGRRPFVVPWRK